MLVLFMDFLYMSIKNELSFFFFLVLHILREILQVIYLGVKKSWNWERKEDRQYRLVYQASHHFGQLEKV